MLPIAAREPFLTSIIEVSAIVESATKASGVTIRMNTGPPGQDVAHLHVHIVPRHLTDGHDGYILGELTQMTEEQRRTQASRLRQSAAGLPADHSPEAGASGPAEGCRICAQAADKHRGMELPRVGEAAIAPSPFQRRGNEGELIVFPVGHVSNAAATTISWRKALVQAIEEADRLLRIATGAIGTTMRQHSGPPSQQYPHLTYAMTPRFAGDQFVQMAPTPVSPIELRRQIDRLIEVSSALNYARTASAFLIRSGDALSPNDRRRIIPKVRRMFSSRATSALPVSPTSSGPSTSTSSTRWTR